MSTFTPPTAHILSLRLVSKPKSTLTHLSSLVFPILGAEKGSVQKSDATTPVAKNPLVSFFDAFATRIPILLPFLTVLAIILAHYTNVAIQFVNSSPEVQKQMDYEKAWGYLPLSYSHCIAVFLNFFFLALMLLMAYWNVSVRVSLFYKPSYLSPSQTLAEKIDQMEKAGRDLFIHVIPEKHQGMEEIIPLVKKKSDSFVSAAEMLQASRSKTVSSSSAFDIFFSYQKRKFKFNTNTNLFEKPSFRNKEKINYYLNYKGIESTKEVVKFADDYGYNRLDIPIPSFWEIFKEHALAPFFVFQVVSVGLWCLDEYWYYSLFTLVMLFVFESTVVKQRQRNLNQIRQMSSKPFRLNVYRAGRWSEISSDLLVPGDLISVKKFQADGANGEDIVCPCDVLLRAGKCVTNEALLTGESTPLLKESIEEHDDPEQNLNLKKGNDKRHIVFGGTSILQHNYSPSEDVQRNHPELCPPDGGCVGIVMKTGFETSQGKLVRLILFTAEHVTASNVEALFFILFLLIFAFLASGYVLYKGLQDVNRSKYKLLLNCIMIITSVVPPELPMELSMAVNNSLLALQKLSIFCTQPFRIPFGGRVTVCCFDKTGTLTSDKMTLKYVTQPKTHEKLNPEKASNEAKYVLSACHSLINMEGHIVGDPMETAGLEGANGKYDDNKVQLPNATFIIHKRFAFASELKRMSVIVEDTRNKKYFVFSKGAPETVRAMLTTVPNNYDDEVTQYSSEGARIIALAWKEYVPKSDINMQDVTTHKHIHRQDVECDLHFCGFAGFDSGIKPDTLETMKELVESNHKVIMITGDNPLTACHVGRELLFVNKPIVISRLVNDHFEWFSETLNKSYNFESYNDQMDYCVTGDILERKQDDFEWLNHWLPKVAVFARTTPAQKELILTVFKNLGYGTLMCGDGTNDVGALKQADVGVALLERRQKNAKQETPQAPQASPQAPPQAPQLQQPKSFKEAWQQAMERAKQAQAKNTSSFNLADLEDENTIVQLGDASIASPFTSKIGNIRSVYHIIRQGRCTLATTMQMYKILALNCLVSAYSLSVLYLDGIKFGDSQMIISGIAVSLAFLFMSRAQPLAKLSKERPQNSIFNFYFMFSLMGQFFIHILILILTARAAVVAQPPDEHDKSVSTVFKPNLVNTTIFIVTSLQTVITFAVNYIGHPFMQSLRENRGLFVCLLILGGICLTAGASVSPELNQALELLVMPNDQFRNFLLVMLFGNIGMCFLWEILCKKLLWSSD